MPVTSTLSQTPLYVGTGLVATYAYGFLIYAATDLVVIERDLNGIETILVLNTDYTVTGIGQQVGGNIVLTSNLTAGHKLRGYRKLPLDQQIKLKGQGAYFLKGIEQGLDTSRMIDQQMQQQLDRCIKQSVTSDEQLDDFDGYLTQINAGIAAAEAAKAAAQAAQVAAEAAATLQAAAPTHTISLSSHGWTDGDKGKLIRKGTGANVFIESNADSTMNAEVVGFVNRIESSDAFVISRFGYLKLETSQWDALCGTIGGLVEKTVYYLNLSGGSHYYTTDISSFTVGQVRLPAFVALSATIAWFLGNRGDEIGSSAEGSTSDPEPLGAVAFPGSGPLFSFSNHVHRGPKVTEGLWEDPNGYGSSATRIFRFASESTIPNSSLVTVDKSTSQGWSITAVVRCEVYGTFSCAFASASVFGVSRNAPSLTTNIRGLNAPYILGNAGTIDPNEFLSAPFFCIAEPGDIIRPHGDGSLINTAGYQAGIFRFLVRELTY